MEQAMPLLKVEDLKMYFPVRRGSEKKYVKAVDGVSFEIEAGKTFGLVGESGCGKTTVGKCILGVNDVTGGSIWYNGVEISALTKRQFKPYRRQIQLIFQDPYGSLDPRQSVFSIVKEAVKADGRRHSAQEVKDRVNELLRLVELDPAMGDRYPHEMSGGQRQRLGIARALACDPQLIVCDEPVSALDVSIQAQIINLFGKLKDELGITYLFIAHDLAVVHHIADRIAVMYLGHFVEVMDAHDLYVDPVHPYTIALLSAVPITDYYEEQKRQRIVLQGEVPSPIDAPQGCPFHPRCGRACGICREKRPELKHIGANHYVACHMIGQEPGGAA